MNESDAQAITQSLFARKRDKPSLPAEYALLASGDLIDVELDHVTRMKYLDWMLQDVDLEYDDEETEVVCLTQEQFETFKDVLSDDKLIFAVANMHTNVGNGPTRLPIVVGKYNSEGFHLNEHGEGYSASDAPNAVSLCRVLGGLETYIRRRSIYQDLVLNSIVDVPEGSHQGDLEIERETSLVRSICEQTERYTNWGSRRYGGAIDMPYLRDFLGNYSLGLYQELNSYDALGLIEMPHLVSRIRTMPITSEIHAYHIIVASYAEAIIEAASGLPPCAYRIAAFVIWLSASERERCEAWMLADAYNYQNRVNRDADRAEHAISTARPRDFPSLQAAASEVLTIDARTHALSFIEDAADAARVEGYNEPEAHVQSTGEDHSARLRTATLAAASGAYSRHECMLMGEGLPVPYRSVVFEGDRVDGGAVALSEIHSVALASSRRTISIMGDGDHVRASGTPIHIRERLFTSKSTLQVHVSPRTVDAHIQHWIEDLVYHVGVIARGQIEDGPIRQAYMFDVSVKGLGDELR